MRVRYKNYFTKLFIVIVIFILITIYLLRELDKAQRAVLVQPNESEKVVAENDDTKTTKTTTTSTTTQTKLEFIAEYRDEIVGNYESHEKIKRVGPGEYGEGVGTPIQEQRAADESVAEFGFNMVASGKISLDRRIKDTRHPECKYWHYSQDLPTASVVLVFHNEGWSVLMRTVHSVINTSPPHLLKDIILVDDDSNTEELKGNLDNYIKRFNGLVKLVRTTKREGLVQARVIGAEHSEGDVIVILDAHCECVVNWLPPLLARIKLNRKTLAVPLIDGLHWKNLEHNDFYHGRRVRGIFEWGFLYKEVKLPEEEVNKNRLESEPYWSPTHAGGLLAIEKNWFFELGTYDPGIRIWGGEQYELSFKVWQCGGVIEWVPCSRVAHAYRGPRTKSVHPKDVHPYQSSINNMRFAEVWMDEYKENFYIRNPHIRQLDIGNISAQVALRDKLQCKPFKWFMENIAYDIVKSFPLRPKNKAWGECFNAKHKVCMDNMDANYGGEIGVSKCHHQLGNQLYLLNVEGELSNVEFCYVSSGNVVIKQHCINREGIWNPVGEWFYDEIHKTLKSRQENKCIETNGEKLFLSKCIEVNPNQKWEFKQIFIK